MTTWVGKFRDEVHWLNGENEKVENKINKWMATKIKTIKNIYIII